MTATRRIAIVLFAGLCAAPSQRDVVAAQNYRMATDELAIQVNADWPGGGQGGYYPLRIRVVNTGPSRELTFRFQPNARQKVPRVERTIQVDQNASRPFTLSIPLVGSGQSGTLEVADENGNTIESLQQPITLPQRGAGDPAPAVLIISEGRVSTRALGSAAVRLAHAQGQVRGGSGGRYGGREFSVEGTHVVPSELPSVWRDYTCVDLAFVDLVTLGELTKDRRRALLQWVECGGTLVVYNVRGAPSASNELRTQLELGPQSPAAGDWRTADYALRAKSAGLLEQAPPMEIVLQIRGGVPRRIRGGGRTPATYRWSLRGNRFYVRDRKFGRIVVFSGDPFAGTEHDWAWFLLAVGPERYRWTSRHGISARRESSDFQKFLIPGIEGVPIYSFLFLITAFTLLIGPVNYFLLWKRKRLFLLVMTIPVIAFGTSLALFGYSVVSNGFNVKTRVRSLTILDQRSQDAVSMSRVAMFSGLPPSGGLRFQNETAVYPVWPYEREFEAGTVDWTDGQRLASGWLRSRTRTQFVTVSRRRERGRLQIGTPQNDALPVSNGFEWAVAAVLVSDRTGKLYFGSDLQPGGSAKLAPAAGPELKQFDDLLRRFPMESDNAADPQRRNGFFDWKMWRGPGFKKGSHRENFNTRYTSNLMERRIAAFRTIRQKSYRLPPGSYLAVFEKNPGLDLGVDDPVEYDGYHLLLGYW